MEITCQVFQYLYTCHCLRFCIWIIHIFQLWNFERHKTAKTRFSWVMQNHYKNARVEISKQINKHEELGSIQKSRHTSNKTNTVKKNQEVLNSLKCKFWGNTIVTTMWRVCFTKSCFNLILPTIRLFRMWHLTDWVSSHMFLTEQKINALG